MTTCPHSDAHFGQSETVRKLGSRRGEFDRSTTPFPWGWTFMVAILLGAQGAAVGADAIGIGLRAAAPFLIYGWLYLWRTR